MKEGLSYTPEDAIEFSIDDLLENSSEGTQEDSDGEGSITLGSKLPKCRSPRCAKCSRCAMPRCRHC